MKTGFDNTFYGNDNISFLYSVLRSNVPEQSLDFCKFLNCIDVIWIQSQAGELKVTLLCFCNNNSTVKGAIYKRTSTSQSLLKMVIKLFDLQFKFLFNDIITHMTRTYMIAQGGDGLSCGSSNKEVTYCKNHLLFIPFHISAINCSPAIQHW